MNADIKSRWIEALRSGDFPQVDGRLTDGTGFCCLGVLCEIALQDGIVTKEIVEDGYNAGATQYSSVEWEHDYSTGLLPEAVWKWAELEEESPLVNTELRDSEFADDPDPGWRSLTELNDEYGWDFNKIADVIEKSL